jgi:hypothetical protein
LTHRQRDFVGFTVCLRDKIFDGLKFGASRVLRGEFGLLRRVQFSPQPVKVGE